MRFCKTATLFAGLTAAVLQGGLWQASLLAAERPIFAAEQAVAQGQAPTDSETVTLNSRTFNIPFRVDAGGTQPVQVELYVSRGAEEPWERSDRQSPTIQEFQFAAPEDGVYWFATRTIDAAGQSHPTGPITPQLKVAVDTESPVIELDAQADDRGQVEVRLDIDDAKPVRSVKLQYATDATGQWQPLDPGQLQRGQPLVFSPTEPWQQLYLHVVASDAAGNQGVASKRVQRPRVAARPQRPLAASEPRTDRQARAAGYRTSPPIARGVAAPGSTVANASTHTDRLPPPATPQQISNGVGTQQGIELTGPNQNESPPERTPRPEQTPTAAPRPQSAADALRPLQGDAEATEQSAPEQEQTASEQPEQRSERPTDQREHNDRATRSSAPESPPRRSNVESIPLPMDASADRSTADDSTADDSTDEDNQTTIDLAELESQVPVRFSDSVRFSLEYDLEAVGSRGVEAVELWGTMDAGETWKRWGTDPDLTSPFDIETRGEGVFGYRSVVVGRNGLVSPSPLDGDLPDIVVVVDTTKPQVRLTSVRYGEEDRTGSLVIRYECRDEHLAERPITLSFSDRPEGPWTTIAAGLRNEGEYLWPADPELPRKIYLRIDAADRADNVGRYILDRPIDAQGLAPRAKIRAFRSAVGHGPATEDGTTARRPSDSRR